MMNRRRPKRVGLVLGGGAARGWAHIGAIRALEEAGIKPDVVCGTSIGALVGAVYANGDLDWLEDWVGKLTWQTVVRLLDLRFSGGLLGGRKVIDLFAHQFNGRSIDDLGLPFTAVATELDTGREVWLREGGVVDAVRASIAIPGIFTPIWHDGVWLVDGGLSNPVPVSAARAMRADTVIAIDLNHDILNGRDLGGAIDTMPRELPVEASDAATAASAAGADSGAESSEAAPEPLLRRNGKRFPRWLQPAGPGASGGPDVRVAPPPSTRVPSVLSSVAQSIDIMQVRITRSRLAGEPADVLIQPRLGGMGIFDFHRAGPAIEEGRAAVQYMMPAIKAQLGLD
ncbi:patatin-like phospholipase family protein [Paraburkholderia silvatlantica]|uniref:NTE family protein n=1 Tax=Paraburkholderia silvatlantica TaxID=321895 RepID=A0A2U1AED6_9BURK|nr:patatin-like phospholipase family protein [Paraburkholderia silvatlantica]MBB2928218.1 NTE family protein [Paraburkholderia silvatlantica]PVY34735.1 NTE family protein [Paraburkholderia silvatlantica]PXW38950.1 NTE family protein [Paraburkholderia silvatlantica]PYE22384.1 NTE family protein [Paraburkholderia silvatlantica]TDQ89762.1 NTE family protein [Paraburkholderia silvatlantica]